MGISANAAIHVKLYNCAADVDPGGHDMMCIEWEALDTYVSQDAACATAWYKCICTARSVQPNLTILALTLFLRVFASMLPLSFVTVPKSHSMLALLHFSNLQSQSSTA